MHWQETFTDFELCDWEVMNMVLPDVMPYFPKRPVNRADWQVKGDVLEVESQENAWSYLLHHGAEAAAVTLEFEFMIPFFTPDRVQYLGSDFLSYRPGEYEPCWETGAVIRYSDRNNFYRVQFGWLAGGDENGPGAAVALWSPQGGFLQVLPWQATPFRYQQVRINAVDDIIEVWLDGELKIHYRDTVAPLAAGRSGLCAAGTQFYRFRNVAVKQGQLQADSGAATISGSGTPYFHTRTFLRQTFLFCNNEPLCQFDRNSSMLREVRLRPGVRPELQFGLHWDQYDKRENFVDVLEEWVIEKEREQEFSVRYRYRNRGGTVYCSGRLQVTYSVERQSYLWDIDTTVEVVPGSSWLNSHRGLSFADPLPYEIVPPAVPQQDPWPCPYKWIVFQAPEGNWYRHPIFHNHVPTVEDQMRLKSNGGLAVVMQHPLSNPALEFDFHADASLRTAFWLCPWAYDIHFLINPYEPGAEIPGGTSHRVKFRYRSVHGTEAETLMQESSVHPYFKSLPERVLFTAGENTFERTTSCMVPHAEYFWRGGERDHEVRRLQQHPSMRLEKSEADGVSELTAPVGGSQFMGRFESRLYTLRAWIKTDNVEGDGVALVARNGKVSACSERIRGTNDWLLLELQTEILYNVLMATVGVELAGTGKVWVDSFELTPLGTS